MTRKSETATTKSGSIGTPLAANVFDNTGRLLVEKGTVLTEAIAERILAAGVKIPKPRKPRAKKEKPQEFIPPPPVTEDKRFQAFNHTYQEKTGEVQRLIADISQGGVVDLDILATHTTSVMSELENKKDLLKYLSFIEGTDDVTVGHSMNVSLLCNLFGQWLNMDEEDLKIITVAGLLHDIGKTLVSPELITKTGKLTDEEFAAVKKHTELGFKLLNERDVDIKIQYAALMHHEKLDGSGYPLGLTADRIHKYASIVTICDIYDAMTANRSYRNKLCPFAIIESFQNKFYGELHTEYLLVFLEKISHSFKNHQVMLSTGDVGEVMHIHPHNISRPIIRTLDGKFIDLSHEKAITILEVF